MKHDEALQLLRAGVNKIGTSEAFTKFLEFCRSFHNYSLHNCILISYQRPDATMVAGFNKWKRLGRFVRRGEKGIAIFAPILREEQNEETGDKSLILRGFKVVYVFDVKQTEGKPIPENPIQCRLLEGEDGQNLYDLLSAHVTDCGVRLTIEPPSSQDARGTYDRFKKHIIIAPNLSPLQRLKTLCHEVAHWKLHSDDEGQNLPIYVKETEAEAVAFLVLAHFGIRVDEYSFAYVAAWSGGNIKVIDRSLKRIKQGADTVIEAIETRLPEAAEPTEAVAV